MNDQLQEWFANIKSKIKNMSLYLQNWSFIVIMVSIIYQVIVNEIIIKRCLINQYEMIKICYQRLIPDAMLTNDKILYQKFIQEKIIKV